jgi:DNA-binding NarL/FixJ family response regulator
MANGAAVELPDGAIRPLVVDSHAASRIGMGVLLEREPWVDRCLLAADLHEAAGLARRHRPEVALLDVSDAGPFIASATTTLRAAHPAIQIVLTSRWSPRPLAPPPRLGATSFLPPEATSDEIAAAVMWAVVAPPLHPPSRSPELGLSPRDRDLLALISTGATNSEIAARLFLSRDGVKKNASALYRKLGVRNRTEAAQRAAELLSAV